MPNQEEINLRESRQTGLNTEQQETSQAAAYSGTTTQTAAPVQQQQQQSVLPATQPPVKQPIQPIMGGQTANPLTENTNGAITSAGIGQGEAQLPAQRQTTSPISAGATGANPNENSAGGVAAGSGEGFNINGIQMNRETWEGSLNFLGNTVALPKSKSTWEGENINFGNIAIPNGTNGRFVLANARVETIVFNRSTGFKSAAITAASISMGKGMKMLAGEPLKANLQKGENAYTLSIPKLTLNGLATPEMAEFQQVVLKMASDGTLIEGSGLSIDTSKFKDLKLDVNGIFVKAANPEIPTKFVDLKLSWEDVQTTSKQTDNAPNEFWGDLNLKEQAKDEKQPQNPPIKFLGNLKGEKQPKDENQPVESEKLSENTAVQGLLTQMQAAYGVDMSGVKIIKNSPEADKQDAVGVSIGNEIHLAKGEFTQSNPEAMGLLAHELTHFVQKEQDRVSADAIFKGQAVNTDPKLEQEADLVAEKFLAQAPLPTLATEKAENPTDEVAQLKPKKPFAEWGQPIAANAGFFMYKVDADRVVAEPATGRYWWVLDNGDVPDFLPNSSNFNGWILLTNAEITQLSLPIPSKKEKDTSKLTESTQSTSSANDAQVGKTLKKTDTKLDKKLIEGQPDKAYIYSNKGVYLGDSSNMSVKGIFFMPEGITEDLIQNPEKLTAANEMGKSFINPLSLCEFYIGANTVKALHTLWQRTKTAEREYGGALYADPTTKELRFEECVHCAEGASTRVAGLSTFGVDSPNEFVASVHTHPYDSNSERSTFDESQDELKYVEKPTSPDDYIAMSDIWSHVDTNSGTHTKAQPSTKRLLGGLGIIAHQHGITIYRHTGEELVDNPTYKPFDKRSDKYTFDPKNTHSQTNSKDNKYLSRLKWEKFGLKR